MISKIHRKIKPPVKTRVRVTPAGIFRGRDAIERELQRVVIELGLHNYSVRRTVSFWKAAWFSTPENGKPNSVMGQQFRGLLFGAFGSRSR